MSGTVDGGKKAAITNKLKYKEDFYSRIGALGGSAPYTGLKGFAANRELAKVCGTKGGRIGSRKGIKNRK